MLENIHKPEDSNRSWIPYKYPILDIPDATEALPVSWAKEHMAIFFKRAAVKNAALADIGKRGGGGSRR